MTGPTRITIHVANLRVQAVSRAEATALAAALRSSLARAVAADPGALREASAERLSVAQDGGGVQPPAARGAAIGAGVAAALTSRKGRG